VRTPRSSTDAFEAELGEKKKRASKQAERFVLRLYVAGSSSRSVRAIQNARQICDEYLGDRCTLEVIDIFQQPQLAKDDQIIAVPTLIKKLPAPIRRFIGDLSDRNVLIVGLDLKRKP